jgi:hypothetical protein
MQWGLLMNIYQHLYSRSFDPSRYYTAFEYEQRGIVMSVLLFNLSGQIVGYQVYRPWSTDKKCNDPKLGRYYTYITAGMDGVFGLETDNGQGPLFIVEGIFKASKLHSVGLNAIATLTSDPKRMKPWLRILSKTRPLIAIGDNDPAGMKLVKRVGRGATSPRDLDEMSSEDVLDFVKGII